MLPSHVQYTYICSTWMWHTSARQHSLREEVCVVVSDVRTVIHYITEWRNTFNVFCLSSVDCDGVDGLANRKGDPPRSS
jgi:hypothetical protein